MDISNEQRDGEVCAYVRERRDKLLAIRTAAQLFAITEKQVMEILKLYHLIDENGSFVQAARMTGKEAQFMKQRAKPEFFWSPGRKKVFLEAYQSGVPVEEIAKKFGTTVDIILKAVSKFNAAIVHTPPADESQPQSSALAVEPGSDEHSRDLVRLKAYIDWAAETNCRIVSNFSNMHEDVAFLELGRQDIYLFEAAAIMERLLSSQLCLNEQGVVLCREESQ